MVSWRFRTRTPTHLLVWSVCMLEDLGRLWIFFNWLSGVFHSSNTLKEKTFFLISVLDIPFLCLVGQLTIWCWWPPCPGQIQTAFQDYLYPFSHYFVCLCHILYLPPIFKWLWPQLLASLSIFSTDLSEYHFYCFCVFMSDLSHGDQAGEAKSRYCLTYCLCSLMNICLSLKWKQLLIWFRTPMAVLAAF